MTDLQEIAESLPGSEVSKMFGMPCMKINGKLFAGDVEGGMVFKLGPEAHAEAMALVGTAPFDPSKRGRAMKEWVVVPATHMDRWMSLAEAAYAYISAKTQL